MRCFRSVSLSLILLVVVATAFGQLPPGVVDTQPNGDTPPTPTESLAKITVPAGFRVSLFAGEPNVHQPIDMTFDDRGRLWVVENFSYPDWKAKDNDRILILEDTDNDGRFDSRKVFAENLSNITGIALGFGGVYACSTPELIFIPDRNRDDKPDGPAIVKLDGWNDGSDEVEHNVFNGLVWGPDGWMYGSHGILADSLIGKPGTPAEQRERMNCGIWRFHPVTEVFQVVAHGTTNPWGIDFDEMGECFFTNSVIGHLWHLIPGARYERMYGNHFTPYAYALIDQCADHYHWGGGRWQDSRGGKGAHNDAGGGHAHVGAMIYRGGVWPEEYQGSLFTANLHGNRLNRDVIAREGSGYVAEHAEDFLFGNDPWFRGIDLLYGPDGNVFVSDWTDLGECHDSDGTHRSSGRIYKVSYGGAKPLPAFDLTKRTNAELLALAEHKNAWYWTHARRLLHERSISKRDMSDVISDAKKGLGNATTPARKLQMLDALALMNAVDGTLVDQLLGDSDEIVQCWAVRFLANTNQLDAKAARKFVELLNRATPKLKLTIASAVRRVQPDSRQFDYPRIATALLENLPANDPNLTAMTWAVIEPLAKLGRERFRSLALIGQDRPELSPLRQFIVRRAMSEYPNGTPQRERELAAIIDLARRMTSQDAVADVLMGIRKSLQGERDIRMPKNWPVIRDKLAGSKLPNKQRLVDELSVAFRDPTTIRRFRNLSRDTKQKAATRRNAITMLADHRVAGTLDLLLGLLDDRTVRETTITSLSQFNKPAVANALVSRFPSFNSAEQNAAVATLISSRNHAAALLSSVANGKIPASAIKPAQAVAIDQLRDDKLRAQLKEHWGDLRTSSREKRQKIAKWKAELTPKVLANANLKNGSKVFGENCGKCHKLFGKGGDIGPELTGSDRRNLDYILQNVITPSAVVGKDFRMQSVSLDDGRVVSGAIRDETPAAIVVQTTEKLITIPRSEIDSIDKSEISLMPEGQFDAISKEAVRDVVAYLSSDLE